MTAKEIFANFKEEVQQTKQAILDGKIYADIKSVSRSGMSRRISFYFVRDGYIVDCTPFIGWLTGWAKEGDWKQGGKYMREDGLKVGGCGMDMIFHTLYSALPYEEAKNWSQNYHRL